jgi:hypothetical protein
VSGKIMVFCTEQLLLDVLWLLENIWGGHNKVSDLAVMVYEEQLVLA